MLSVEIVAATAAVDVKTNGECHRALADHAFAGLVEDLLTSQGGGFQFTFSKCCGLCWY